MNRLTKPLPGTVEDPRYPDSDGRFMGDTEYHNVAMIQLRQALEDHFAGRDDVYVTSNLVMYFQEGDPKARKDPDVLVAKGVRGNHKRRSYRFWEERVVPCTLFEIASPRTWRNDIGEKRDLYARIGVREYFVFDPEGIYLKPPFQGYRLVKGGYVPLKADRRGALVSKELGLTLKPEEDVLRLIDRATGLPVLTRAERAEMERQRAEQEARRAAELAAEVERLRARLAELEP